MQDESKPLSVTEMVEALEDASKQKRFRSALRVLPISTGLMFFIMAYMIISGSKLKDQDMFLLWLGLGISFTATMIWLVQLAAYGTATFGVVRCYRITCAWYDASGMPQKYDEYEDEIFRVLDTDWQLAFDKKFMSGRLKAVKPGTRPEISYAAVFRDPWARAGFLRSDNKHDLVKAPIGRSVFTVSIER